MATGAKARYCAPKVFFWLASRPDWVGIWSQAGGAMQYGCAGRWCVSVPESEWSPENEEFIRSQWQEPYGDCRQELVFIGQNLDEEAIRTALNNCLLTDIELLAGRPQWETYPDSFSPWLADGQP